MELLSNDNLAALPSSYATTVKWLRVYEKAVECPGNAW